MTAVTAPIAFGDFAPGEGSAVSEAEATENIASGALATENAAAVPAEDAVPVPAAAPLRETPQARFLDTWEAKQAGPLEEMGG